MERKNVKIKTTEALSEDTSLREQRHSEPELL